MIITMIYGGLGNQMFQYAIAKSIANKNGVNFQLDISRMNSKYFRDFNLEKFKIDLNIAKEEDVRSYKSLYLLESLSRRLKVNFFIDKYLEKKEFSSAVSPFLCCVYGLDSIRQALYFSPCPSAFCVF